MKLKLSSFALAAMTFVLMTTTAVAVPIPGLFNTGVDGSGNPLPNSVVDPNWVLSSGPSGTPTAITGNPIPGSWVPNTTTSRWVTPNNSGLSSEPGGTYTYDLTFDLAGLLPTTALISGMWASDNQSNVLLNGTPFASHSGLTTAFTFFDSFSIGPGSGLFLPGINTLTIQVTNGGGPSGVHVTDLRGDALPIPEPATLLLAAFGITVLISQSSVMRRRKSNR